MKQCHTLYLFTLRTACFNPESKIRRDANGHPDALCERTSLREKISETQNLNVLWKIQPDRTDDNAVDFSMQVSFASSVCKSLVVSLGTSKLEAVQS